jgi:MoaA/NifB/PqqE/SkfB family radical SAM enzyme
LGVSLRQKIKVGTYVLRQRLAGRQRYPLVLMLEPLFRCNLSCFGCGKIDYPDAILNKRLSVQECLDAVDECGAPMVAIPGGEPLIHKEIGEIVKGIVARKKFVSLCTNALLLEKKLHLFEPSPYLFFSVHLDGIKQHHDKSVCMEGGYEKAVDAIKAAKAQGFTVNVNCTIFDGHPAEDIANFLNRRKTKELFRQVFALGKANNKGKNWNLTHSSMFLDFLAGNQEFHCTPWGMPTRNIFGWQKPCYLLGEGYAETFTELMETTDWETYGTGRYEKCANCMAHCGYEPTAAEAMLQHPLEAFMIGLRGVRTRGPMAPEISLENQRPAQYVFDNQVQLRLSEIRANEAREKAAKEAAKQAAQTSASAA